MSSSSPTSPMTAVPPTAGARRATRAIEWFIPTRSPDPVEHLRTQLYVVFSFLVAANGALFGTLHAVHHLPGSSWTVVWVLALICGASLCFPWLLRAGGSLRVLVPAFMVFFEVAVVAVTLFDGGLRSGAVFWLVFLPLVAAFIGGARLGWAIAAVSAIVGASLFGAHMAGWAFSTALTPEKSALHYVLNFVCAVALTGVLAALYEGPMVRHLGAVSDQLEEANDALRSELAERRQAQARAEAASQAKDALLSNMSHEFRTPLTAILGFTDMLVAEVDADQRPFLQAIDRGAQRLLGTLDGVLELSWIASSTDLPCEPVAMGDLARACAATARLEAAGRELSVEVVGDGIARADPRAAGLVLAALVHNAVRFTDRGRIVVTVVQGADEVRVDVADTGIGMPAEFVGVATEPFRQASEGHARTHEGVGLGLTIAQQLTRKMHGRLEIASLEGRGTTVSVCLPAAPVPPPAAESRPRSRVGVA